MPKKQSTSEQLWLKLLKVIERLNGVSARLLEQKVGVFPRIATKTNQLSPPEMGFIRGVSWLYVHYYEAWKVSVDFLGLKIGAYGLAEDNFCKAHHKLILEMQIFLRNNLDLKDNGDKSIQENCEAWLNAKCGTKVPTTDAQWHMCLDAIIKEASAYIQALIEIVDKIEDDESRDVICKQWRIRLLKHFSPSQFDTLIAVVAADMGRKGVDQKVRRQCYEKWEGRLSLLDAKQDIHTEARRIIEYELLTSEPVTLPITGQDIISELSAPPGAGVARLLEQALKLYLVESCTKEVLLSKLRLILGQNAIKDNGAIGNINMFD